MSIRSGAAQMVEKQLSLDIGIGRWFLVFQVSNGADSVLRPAVQYMHTYMYIMYLRKRPPHW